MHEDDPICSVSCNRYGGEEEQGISRRSSWESIGKRNRFNYKETEIRKVI